jgi:hypothetical protein
MFIIEDGTGVAGANAYVTVDECTAYCETHGLPFGISPTLLGEQAIIRATSSLDAMYRTRFPGTKAGGRAQTLAWPRKDAVDADGNAIALDEIPQEIKEATCELAVRELAEPVSTMPDLERGGAIKRLKAGSVEIEYGANAPAVTVFSKIDGILAGLLGAPPSPYTARAVRA